MRDTSSFWAGFIVIVALILVVGLLVDICSPSYGFFARVPVGNVAVVTNFGKIKDDVKEPGFHRKGFFDHYICLDTRTQKISGELAAFSKDMQEVDIHMNVNYNVTAETAVKLYKEVNRDYDAKIISPIITESAKVVFARYTAEELITNRGNLADAIKHEIVEGLNDYNINISLVTIDDIDFSDAFTNAVEAKQVATQEKLKAQTEQEQQTAMEKAEAERKVIKANADAEAKMAQADAEAYATKAKADAEAYALKTTAEAEAEANRQIADSITEELINYNRINRWNGVMPSTLVGESGELMPILNIEGD